VNRNAYTHHDENNAGDGEKQLEFLFHDSFLRGEDYASSKKAHANQKPRKIHNFPAFVNNKNSDCQGNSRYNFPEIFHGVNTPVSQS
jgi:hypothetical protein